MLRRVAPAFKTVTTDSQAVTNDKEWIVPKTLRPLAKVESGALGEETKVQWNEAALVSLGNGRDAIKMEMAALAVQRAEDVAWSA